MAIPIFPASNNQSQLGNARGHTGFGWCPNCKKQVRYQFLVLDNKLSTQSRGWCCSECELTLIALTMERLSRKIVNKYIDPQLEAHVTFSAQKAMNRPFEEVEDRMIKHDKKTGKIYE